MIDNFQSRLREYKEKNKLQNKELAQKLNISESFYSLIESGKKNPSKNFMSKLVAETGKPEEYWIYGIDDSEYINAREDLKCTKRAVEQIVELGLAKDVNKLFKGKYDEGTLEELLVTALKADIQCYIEKTKK